MKALIRIDMQAALKRGSNKYGEFTIEFDPAELTEQQRELLSKMSVKDGAFDVERGIPERPGGVGRIRCPGEFVDDTVDELKAALDRFIAKFDQEKAARVEQIKAYTEEFLAKPDEDCIGRRYNDDYFTVGAYPMEYADKTDPHMIEKIARLEKLAEEKSVAYRAEQAEKKRLDDEAKAAEEKRLSAAHERLKEWGLANGSELLRLRIEEEINWIKLAKNEFIKAHSPEGYGSIPADDVKDRTNPKAEEILELRRLRKLCEESDGTLQDPELAWYVDNPDVDESEYEYPEDVQKPDKFPVARVKVFDPTGTWKWAEKRF